MRNTYEPGRSRWTTATGWLMLTSALGALVCTLLRLSPYPPLTPALACAGASAFFACCWIAASYAARPGPLEKAVPDPRAPGRILPYVFAIGVPLATAAALSVAITPSSAYGQRAERLERAGWDRHEAEVVRLTGEPDCTAPDDDVQQCFTDLVLRIPYTSGTREVSMPGMRTRTAPEPGWELTVYYAAGDPEVGVGTEPARDQVKWWLLLIFAVAVVPWFVLPMFFIRAQLEPGRVHTLRRWRPRTHLPALGHLFGGLVLLLPAALEVPVAGFMRLPALLAALTPGLALRSVAKRAGRVGGRVRT
ncbi:hypothetical protein [Streptomyces sp. NBC_00503]|uniref:hypothetical protein n=1 Tax=Streptomyces sp. NBC_00503 TaxID=2903659 RepID=UPI002E80605B|nr:hypothetical protein [Streptomyces sp. NBC_00503]WUD81972.1 hypothetical protein OG490_16270 [Streptomyces sp. NBC_00503]